MSIDIAIGWSKRIIRSQRAAADAVAMFAQAQRQEKRATLLLSSSLTRDGKGWLGRWTGSEFVALELLPGAQQGLGIASGAMCRQLEELADERSPHTQCLTLSGVEIGGTMIPSDQPIVGRCLVTIDDPSTTPQRNCALRCEFYRPDLRRAVTGYSHLDTLLHPGSQKLEFKFPPLECEKNPGAIKGTLVRFLQMVTVERWSPVMTGLREISNTAVSLIELRR